MKGFNAERVVLHNDCPFSIPSLGKVSGDKMSHVLNPLQDTTYSLTNKKLALTLMKFSHPTEQDCILLAICKHFYIYCGNLIVDLFFRPTMDKYPSSRT